MWYYLYDTNTKIVMSRVTENIDIDKYMDFLDGAIKNNTEYILLNENIPNYRNCKIIGEKLVEMSSREIQELQQHGKILTEVERMIVSLKPSHEEVTKAENTIEILTLLQEVL